MNELKFIGIGDAITIELGGNCCYMKNERQLLVLDACEGAALKLSHAGCFDTTEEVFIAITHLHFDHIGGLGSLIWQCFYRYGIKPKLLYGDDAYRADLDTLLRITGVKPDVVQLVKDSEAAFTGLKIAFMSTRHEPTLRCHGLLLTDGYEQCYYSGDTNDIALIRQLAADPKIKKIYVEVSRGGYGVHIKYDELLSIKQRSKLVLMHFDTAELKEQSARDGFATAERSENACAE